MPIEQITLPPALGVDALWPSVARATQDWLRRNELAARDAVLLVPFAALLPLARAALAGQGGWQPRVETPLTLAGALGPPEAPDPSGCTGDEVLDPMAADLLLRQTEWGAAWAARDPAGFHRLVSDLVQAAQSLRAAAACRLPMERDAYWAALRDALPPAQGPAAVEALLLRVALEWAASGSPPVTDRLFDLRPSAWIVLRLGGAEPQAEALLGHAGLPSLQLMADPPVAEPYAQIAPSSCLERVQCDDFEAESQAAAAAVIEALNAGRQPVALVTLDREVVRRVRALLVRAQVPLLDETGWLLATTRVAAALLSRLRAALPQANADEQLDWLKTWPAAAPRALNALEARWRGRSAPGQEAADELLAAAATALAPLRERASRPLSGWLTALWQSAEDDGQLAVWQADAAGAQVLAALGWPHGGGWWALAGEWVLDLPGFIAWVQATLEQQPFLPLPDPGAQVVLVPLARAFGRPFAQVVMPGADAQRLGGTTAKARLLPQALAELAGVPGPEVQRDRQRLALAQLMRCPHVTVLRRRRDGDEPLAESPEITWLALARQQAAAPQAAAWITRVDQPPVRDIEPVGLARPQPQAPQALPATLSASRLEALLDCPYRFFSRAVLRLDEAEEIEAGVDKRDYGTWLHAVLHRFHRDRDPAVDALTQLQQSAAATTQDLGIDEAGLLPFTASFNEFAPAYVAWLLPREASGWHWVDGEADRSLALPAADGRPALTLKGRIDRIDHGPGGLWAVIDYKTSNTQSLKDRVRSPLEDTQLAFYAALMDGDTGQGAAATASGQAAYLSLDDAQAPQWVPHPAVQASAQALVAGVAQAWQDLAAGAPMPALGDGAVCEHCEARGLCRRDHWSPA